MSRRLRDRLAAGEEPDPRFSLANERTLLAWLRTALGLAAAGLATYAFADDEIPPHLLAPAALLLLAAAAVLALAALHRWFAIQVAMRTGRPLPLPWLALPVVLLVVLSVGVGAGLVLR